MKRYKPEVGSDLVQRLFLEPNVTLVISAITLAETYAALQRYSRKDRLSHQESTKVLDGVTVDVERGRFNVLDVTSHHVARTRYLITEYSLTSHDALILASAIDFLPFEIVFVCADVRSGLLRAAETCGLSTLNPLSPSR